MRKRLLSRTAWLTILMGSMVSGVITTQAADVLVPSADPRAQPNPPSHVPASAAAAAPIVTAGPIYAYGPIIQSAKPRQRARRPYWGNQNNSRSNGMRTAAPYWNDGSQGATRPWQSAPQSAPPRYNWSSRSNNNPYRYGYQGPWQDQQQRPWTSPQNPNALAWYERGERRVDAPDRARQPSQPNWRY
jgi:hypothetical protein